MFVWKKVEDTVIHPTVRAVDCSWSVTFQRLTLNGFNLAVMIRRIEVFAAEGLEAIVAEDRTRRSVLAD